MKENATRADRELRIARTHEEKLFRLAKSQPFPARFSRGNFVRQDSTRGEI